MTAVDKAAIVWTIAIVIVGVAIAGMGDQLQSSPTPQTIAQELSLEKSSESMEKMEESMEKQKEMIEPEVTPEPEVMSGPVTVEVSMPTGTAVPGCEETNECFVPASVSINVGDTIVWSNDDSAAHTVTSGSPAEGPSGMFDSSLLIAGGTYEYTFDASGTVDYFCMVHPWMIGTVQVS